MVVAVGQNVALPLTLGVATVQESVTVTGASPIVDATAMGTATNFTQDELSTVPNSRDPWALLRTVPGVTVDRVNIGGNETGQQAAFVSKGGRQGDAVWTMDGVPITDMATAGASPTYFDYDAFDEIQISTGGNDIKQATGGVGLNFVVKRGTNQLRGTARGYYTDEGLESTNLPDELAARGVTPETADHNQQISEMGFDVGGPILKDKLFFWGSIANQDIRLYRQSARGTDRTVLKTYNAKVNWQATSKDMVNFLFFNGDKIKEGRAPGHALFEPTSARWNQGNYYTDNPLHGLWKIEDNRVFSNNLFVTGKYAYYNTGFTLNSIGPLTEQMGISALLRPDVRLDQRQLLPRARSIRSMSTATTSRTMGDDHARLQVRHGLAPDRHLLANAVSRQRHRRLRELGDRLPGARLSRGRRHEPRVVYATSTSATPSRWVG